MVGYPRVRSRPQASDRADLVALGEGRFEVIGGEIVEKAAPPSEHSDAQVGLAAFLRTPFHHGGGPRGPGGWWIVTECDVELETHEIHRPDLVGWRRSRVPERPRGRPARTRPDWICEVLSRSNARNDLVNKLRVDMESRDLLQRFHALPDRLAPRYRLVFALRYLESMTIEEIAAHMELSVSTVKRALERATSKLSLWIEADSGLGALLDEKGCLR